MTKTVSITVAKPAKKAAVAPQKLGSAASAMAAQLIAVAAKVPPTVQELKANRDAERAKRYPQAAALEADKKVGVKTVTPKEKKEVTPRVAFVPRTAKAGQVLHILDERSRPASGARLFAHTHAVLTILGLLEASRPAVPQSHLLQMLGQRAVAHHRSKLNIEDAPNHGARLSIAGRNHFTSRLSEGKVDTSAANAFVKMFLDGSIDHGATGIAQRDRKSVV